uniref:Tetratricopeptide repeat protein n=1 Tax=Solanum tuberosum TaxID=4113 RepID=M1BIL9_SOLTU
MWLKWLENFSEQHFPSSIQEKISDMEYQIDRCIQALESVPQEKRQSQYECLKGRLYNAIPDVYNEEAECHLLKALEIDAVKSHPFLHYDCGLVNRYLENYKGFLIGFSDVASKNPASDALHQLTLMLQLLDKLEGLLQGKLNDKSKGKSMETSLSSLIQSLATIDLDPSYTRATMDLLTEGLNEGIAVIGAVRCLVKYEYKAPSYYVICDSDEKSFVLTVFGIQKEAHYQFKSVRVNLLKQVLVNGNALSPDFASRESLL